MRLTNHTHPATQEGQGSCSRELDIMTHEIREDQTRRDKQAKMEQLSQYREWHSSEEQIGQYSCLVYQKSMYYVLIFTVKCKSSY